MPDRTRWRVGVFGAGAMGALYGGLLADAGAETWLITRSPEQAAEIEDRGVLLTHDGAERPTRPRASTSPASVGEVDLLMVWVKSQDTDAALAAAAPMIGERTLVASFQNGLGNTEKIAAAFGRSRVVYGVSTIGGVRRGPGALELTAATWNGEGTTWMGVMEGDAHRRLEPLKELFERAGIRTELRLDIDVVVWSKLAMAAPMNLLAALTRLSIGGVIDDPGLCALQRQMTAEIVEVAQARGIPLHLEDALRHAEHTYGAARAHLPSMLQDVMSARSTEVEALAGVLVGEAHRLGVDVPATAIVWALAAALDDPHGVTAWPV